MWSMWRHPVADLRNIASQTVCCCARQRPLNCAKTLPTSPCGELAEHETGFSQRCVPHLITGINPLLNSQSTVTKFNIISMDNLRDYGQDQELIKQFLRDVTYIDDDGNVKSKYASALTKLANREQKYIHVDLADMEKFNQDLANQISTNTKRYTSIFYKVLDEILPSYKTSESEDKDVMDIFIEQRLFIAERNQRNNATGTGQGISHSSNPNTATGVDIDGVYPADLIRRAELYFKPASLTATPIRDIQAEHIGHLVNVRGIVTRVTDVKPTITIATYTCDQCGCESFQPISGSSFMPLQECSSSACKADKTLGRLNLQVRGSKFIRHQEIKIQEHSDQVPTGHIPRTVTIEAYGEQTRNCIPGDHVSVSGIFLPIEKQGYRLRTGGLTADTCIEAHYITLMSKSEEDELNDDAMSSEEAKRLIEGEENFLDKLSSSIAPEIFGHEELKKALLLLLVGGVDTSPRGMKVRGNINICLMGDPGVAKSQLLSFIDRLASRSQYTTGRGSSGVGLTAAILKDPITDELVLEGGALVLADGGICCIDEFDKMMDADRTAIHEVMEQQTVSIAKAGIMTTLNARVSILAAANPAYGRYNVHRNITDNLQLPPALLSRFDLLWLILDKADQTKDKDLASHITHVHSNPSEQAANNYDAIDMKVMRRYIKLCKSINPEVPKERTKRLTKIYLKIRERKRLNKREDALFTSPRSLLAVIRLATAFARLRLSRSVDEPDIKAAVRLYDESRKSIERTNVENSAASKIHEILKRMAAERQSRDLVFCDVIEKAEKEGFTEDQVEWTLNRLKEFESIDYEGHNILLLNQDALMKEPDHDPDPYSDCYSDSDSE